MREIVKKCMWTYNILALPFVPLVVYAFTFETPILSKVCRFFINWFTLLAAGLIMPLQNYLIPQIIAVVLICLYGYDLIRTRELFPIRRETRSFWALSTWTILSAACILWSCLALQDGIGEPLT